MVAGAVDAAVFSPREKPVAAPVLAAAIKQTHAQIIQITDRKIIYWPQLFVQCVFMSKSSV